MGLIRLLFLLAIGFMVARLLLRALARPATPSAPAGEADYIPLIRCSTCGAHIPQPRAGAAPICERCRSG